MKGFWKKQFTINPNHPLAKDLVMVGGLNVGSQNTFVGYQAGYSEVSVNESVFYGHLWLSDTRMLEDLLREVEAELNHKSKETKT